MLGVMAILKPHIRWGKNSPVPGDSMTFTAMSGNGYRTGMTQNIIRSAQCLIRRDPKTEPEVFFVVVVFVETMCFVVPVIGILFCQLHTGTIILAFVWYAMNKG